MIESKRASLNVALQSENPPNGSLGIVQVLSKTQRPFKLLSNPPNGSLGIVQVRPIYLLLDFLN